MYFKDIARFRQEFLDYLLYYIIQFHPQLISTLKFFNIPLYKNGLFVSTKAKEKTMKFFYIIVVFFVFPLTSYSASREAQSALEEGVLAFRSGDFPQSLKKLQEAEDIGNEEIESKAGLYQYLMTEDIETQKFP